MYISFRNPYPMQDDSASLVVFRRLHRIAVVAEVVVVATVIVGSMPAFHIATVGFVPPAAWRLSQTQDSVAYLSLWGLTLVAVCLVPLGRYAMLRSKPSLTQSRVLRRLFVTSLVTFFLCAAPALLACALFVLDSRPGGEWFPCFLLLSLFLLFAFMPIRSYWEERLRAVQPAIQRADGS
jgi:hypothetical protein